MFGACAATLTFLTPVLHQARGSRKTHYHFVPQQLQGCTRHDHSSSRPLLIRVTTNNYAWEDSFVPVGDSLSVVRAAKVTGHTFPYFQGFQLTATAAAVAAETGWRSGAYLTAERPKSEHRSPERFTSGIWIGARSTCLLGWGAAGSGAGVAASP